MPFIETRDGTSLFYNDWGRGRPIVFLHGWTLNSDIWEYQMAPLVDRGVRVIAYDRRGHGRSSQPANGYDFDTLAEDLGTVLERLTLRDVTLVGHSMGAGEIARYLSSFGADRIAGAVLVAPVTPFILKTDDNPDGVEGAMFDAIVAALGADRPRFLSDGAPAFFGGADKVSPELLRWGVDIALRASARAAIECVRSYSRTDFRGDMPAFTVPTLILHGDADASAPLELTARKTAAAIRGSQLTVYAGAPHALFLTEKERFNRDLLAFVAS